jgi:COMPASS component SWD3
VRLWDVDKQTEIKAFCGHKLAVTSVIFNTYGNLVISGYPPPTPHAPLMDVSSKDQTVCFWDALSGVCVNTLTSGDPPPPVGELSGLDISADGLYLLTCAKANLTRIWDLRMVSKDPPPPTHSPPTSASSISFNTPPTCFAFPPSPHCLAPPPI